MKGVCQAAILLAGVFIGCSAQSTPSALPATDSGSTSHGAQATFTQVGNATRSRTVSRDGRAKTVGAASTADSMAVNSTDMVDADAIRGPPAMSEVETESITGEPAPTVMSPPMPVAEGEEGAVRLVGRVDVNGYATGTLQVFSDGAWGAVCTSNFDDRDATVACRQLGFIAGIRRRNAPSYKRFIPEQVELKPFALVNLGCLGNESRLVDCPVAGSTPDDGFTDYSSPDISCDPYHDTYARIACGSSDAASEGDLRLALGASAADGSAEFGRLEVFYKAGWGTICDNAFVNMFGLSPRFTPGSADVACRQLGYKQGFQMQPLVDNDPDSTARIPVVLGGATCSGTEQSLSTCPNFKFDNAPSNCREHVADVYLVCSGGPNPEMDGATRLADGSADPVARYEYGRLEMFANGFWSNVCNNDRFTPNAAQVACRDLGYDGGVALRFTQSYAESLSTVLFDNLPVAIAAVDCNGTEATISECQNNPNLVGECDNMTSSTILACCDTATGCTKVEDDTQGAVRLRGGFGTLCDPIHSGFVEVLNFGEWGSICTDQNAENSGKDNLVADVVCRQLGFPHGTRVDPLTARLPQPPRDAAMAPYSSYHYDDYTIVEEAEEPVELFWLSEFEVACAGPESSLVDCYLGEGFHRNDLSCSSNPHRMHIACRQFPVVEALEEITTTGAEEGDVRLIEEEEISNWVTGRLQVFFEGSWSQVCASGFDAVDADVACRQLGFGSGTVIPKILSAQEVQAMRRNNVFPEIAIIGSGCTGTEDRLLDCASSIGGDEPFFRQYTYGRTCLSSIGAGLVIGCVSIPLQGPAAGTEGEFRLTNRTAGATEGSESGIMEVFHDGAWGTLCDGDFEILESSAEIACRDMGFVSGFFADADQSAALQPPWLSGIRCAGFEASLGACRRSGFGETESCGRVQRLFCVSSLNSNRQEEGVVRLVEGSADPGGAWEYGRLEVIANGVWNVLFGGLGRRGAQVACRTLGFTTGAQMLVGGSSPFPASQSVMATIETITCEGSEPQLKDCKIDFTDKAFRDYGTDVVPGTEALVCTTPSGCDSPAAVPVEGDVRLVPLNGTAVATAPCDDVHFGGVELFHEGRWGRICDDSSSYDSEDFTVDAQVICRQMGFPFGTVMESGDLFYAYAYDYFPQGLTWATEVRCTGKEDRLLDCFFPEEFGVAVPVDYDGSSNYDYSSEISPTPSDAEPAPAPVTTAPPPSSGLTDAGCSGGSRSDNARLAVICRKFEITESEEIRR